MGPKAVTLSGAAVKGGSKWGFGKLWGKSNAAAGKAAAKAKALAGQKIQAQLSAGSAAGHSATMKMRSALAGASSDLSAAQESIGRAINLSAIDGAAIKPVLLKGNAVVKKLKLALDTGDMAGADKILQNNVGLFADLSRESGISLSRGFYDALAPKVSGMARFAQAYKLPHKQFINKYLLAQKDRAAEQAFVSIPENLNLVNKLSGSSSAVKAAIDEGMTKLPWTTVFGGGLTFAEKAKNFGIGAAALGGAGLVAANVYGAFEDNPPVAVASNFGAAVNALNLIRFSSNPPAEFSQIKNSCLEIARANAQLQQTLATDEPNVEPLLNKIMQETQKIVQALSNTQAVEQIVRNSTNQRATIRALQAVGQAVEKQVQLFNGLGGAVGVSRGMGMVEIEPEEEARPAQGGVDSNVIKIQTFLSRLYPEVRVSGQIDSATERALRALEAQFTSQSGIDHSNTLYNPRTKTVIPHGQLINRFYN